DFIGRAGIMQRRSEEPARRFSTFIVDAADADAIGDEPIFRNGEVVGWVTSGGCGHCVGKSIALGYVAASVGDATEGFEIEILGERRRAVRSARPLYDPDGL